MLKIIFFMPYFRGKLPKYVLTPLKKTSYHIFKMGIFSKFFVDIMTHIIGWNAGKRIKPTFELFTKQKIGFRFVLFLSVQSLISEWSRRENIRNWKLCSRLTDAMGQWYLSKKTHYSSDKYKFRDWFQDCIDWKMYFWTKFTVCLINWQISKKKSYQHLIFFVPTTCFKK